MWKPEILVKGAWLRNGLSFATEQEAKDSGSDLLDRWMAAEDYRAVEIPGAPPTHSYVGRELKAMPE